MGRDAFITRLAFGRSPYEPLDTLQRSSSPSSPPPTTQEPDENVEYIQLYDQRGHPQNPRSRALAKALRNAQNDVLSAIGVVERKELHARLLQKAEREKLEARRKDNEETHAIWLSFVSGVVTEVLTAPVEVLKQRLLVSAVSSGHGLLDVGARLYNPSSMSRCVYTTSLDSLYTVIMPRIAFDNVRKIARGLIDTVIFRLSHTRSTRRIFNWWRPLLESSLCVAAEIALAPLLLHSTMMLLLPGAPMWLVPPLLSFLPFSALSPIQVVPFPPTWTISSALGWLNDLSSAPLVLLWLHARVWTEVYKNTQEACERYILRPREMMELPHDEDMIEDHVTEWLLQRFGWAGTPNTVQGGWAALRQRVNDLPPPTRMTVEEEQTSRAMYAEAVRDINSTTPHPPTGVPAGPTITSHAASGQSDDNLPPPEARPAEELGASPPFTPISDIIHGTFYSDDEDSPQDGDHWQPINGAPGVRIASRNEGTIELEITVNEDVRTVDAFRHQQYSEVPTGLMPMGADGAAEVGFGVVGGQGRARKQRVTALTTMIAESCSSWMAWQLTDLVLLPIKVLILRSIAARYIPVWPTSTPTSRTLALLPEISWRDSWRLAQARSTYAFIGQIGLCWALEGTITLALNGVQAGAALWIGQRVCGWRMAR